MNTITNNINKIIEIKDDLNEVLRENGIEGGDIFEEYPEKFRELFRVLLDTSSAETASLDYENVNIVVPNPTIWYNENIVYVQNNLSEAAIYYYIISDSGDADVGTTLLTKGGSIMISESSTVFVQARWRGEESEWVSIYVPWDVETVPEPPVITRGALVVTITVEGEYDAIMYSIGDMNHWEEYTEPFDAPARTQDIYAYAKGYRGKSDTVIDEAPEKPQKPEKPVITYYRNVITITCATAGTTIKSKNITDKYYMPYTGPYGFNASGYFIAIAEKDGVLSDESDVIYCQYYPVPAKPTIQVSNNVVYMSTATAGAEIWYKIDDGEWQLYETAFAITEDMIIEAYAIDNDMPSPHTTVYCAWVDYHPADVTITFADNVVTMTCATQGATIMWKTDGEYVPYTGPIEISESDVYYAYATKDGYDSYNVTSYSATYVPPVTPVIPEAPVFSCSNNIVTITCSTINATILYKVDDAEEWTTYTAPFEITETTTFVAYATKNGEDSSETTYTATYVEPIVIVPAVPVISCDNNMVTMTCSTVGATIWYRNVEDGTYIQYTGPFEINASAVYVAYSELNGVTSAISDPYTALYETIIIPEVPVITCKDNIVYITCSTPGATIKYKINDGTWMTYGNSFIILNDITVYAYSLLNRIESEVTYLDCVDSEVRYSQWMTVTYGKYEFPFSGATGFTSTSQLYNTKKPIAGISDRIRFVYYHGIIIQLSDMSYARYIRKAYGYRLNPENFFTTTDISKAIKLRWNSSDAEKYARCSHSSPNYLPNLFANYIPQTFSINVKTIGRQQFDEGVYYIGYDDYVGHATATFGVPKILSNDTSLTVTADTLPKFMQILLSRRWQGNLPPKSTGVLASDTVRFETPDCFKAGNYGTKQNYYPVDQFFYVNSTICGVRFYENTKYPLLWNKYYIELS